MKVGHTYLFLEGSTPIEYTRDELCELFETHKDTHFIYDTHREMELTDNLREWVYYINKSLTKSNSKFTCIIAGNRKQNYYGRTKVAPIEQFDRINIIQNHNHFIRLAVERYEGHYKELYESEHTELKQNFDYFLHYLNNKPHWHRCQLMNEIQGTDLLDNSFYTWSKLTSTYDEWAVKEFPWTNWKEKLVYDKDETELAGYVDFEDEYVLNEKHHSAVHLISESTLDCFFLTEKTVKPLILGNLFLVGGVVNFHKELKKLGFELYDEIFDYSFDTLTDYNERTKGIITNLEKIKDEDYNKLYQICEKKIKHNQKRCWELAYGLEENIEIVNIIKNNISAFRKLVNTDEYSMFCKSLAEKYFKSLSVI